MTRPRLTDRIHATTWTSTDHVEAIAFASGYPMEVLADADGTHYAVVTREGIRFAAMAVTA